MNQITLELQPKPSYRLIPLTRDQVAKVDAADFDWLSQWKWQAHFAPNTRTFYARRDERFSRGPKGRRTIYMHRLILGIVDDAKGDHRSGDTLDNRRGNLRCATHSQNSRNQIRPRDNTSGFIGVCPFAGKWQAYIRVDGKKKHLGSFSTPEEASAVRTSAAREHYGEFFREEANHC